MYESKNVLFLSSLAKLLKMQKLWKVCLIFVNFISVKIAAVVVQ